MLRAFKPCPLEKNIIVVFKSEDEESCYSNSITAGPMATKRGGTVTYIKGLLSIKSYSSQVVWPCRTE